MKISDLVNAIQATVLTGDLAKNCEVSTGYCCDLLSRVMAAAQKDCIWMTVLTHLNIIAVAQLADIGAVVIPEDIPVPQQTVDKAVEEGINLISTPLTSYEVSWKIHELMNK